jgi:hypothetical protein
MEMENIDDLKKQLKEYKQVKYYVIFFRDLKDTLYNWFYILCSIIWLTSTGIQIYLGKSYIIASITSLPMILVPIILAIATCLDYKSFVKFDKGYINFKISQNSNLNKK